MNKNSLFANIIAIWCFVGKRRRWQFAGLFVLMFISVLAEMASLGAIVPFLSALTNPEGLMSVSSFQPVLLSLDITSADELLLPLTVTFLTAALLAAGMRIMLLWVNTRLSASMAIQLRSELYQRALYRPYAFHLANNSSQLISLVTEKIGFVGLVAILHVLMLVVALLTSTAIIVTLLLIDPIVALLTFSVLGGGYLLMGYLSRRILKRNSHIVAYNQPLAIKQLQEGIGGIRDVILDQTQETFLRNYTDHVRKVQLASSSNSFVSQLPKSVLELMGIVMIVCLAFYLEMKGQQALPILGALALGSQRLLPSLQQMYFSWSTVVGAQAVIAEVVTYLKEEPTSVAENNIETISFKQSIVLEHVGFKYDGTAANVLNDVCLNIPKGSCIGFIGETGSGKSTLLDLVMGLLAPTEGKIFIDGIKVDSHNQKSWQKHIAHVPQSIYLSDSSITENIAFGVPKEQIDFERVVLAASQAHLHKFIEQLPNGYDTYVGERGVQLSGGQRQRIGIARALYKQAEVIIFDEATSALDDVTEEIVTESISSLDKNLTVLTIAHRLSTLKGCDVIYKMSNGIIVDSGPYSKMCSIVSL